MMQTYPGVPAGEAHPTEHAVPTALPRRAGQIRIGIFEPNESWAYWPSLFDRGTDWTYQYNCKAVQLAEEIGCSFAFPAGRWKGLVGDDLDWRGVSLDTVTLTAGLLQATSRIVLLTTIHTNVFHPVVAAKFGADLDQIGEGRWGLNIVSGWGVDEFKSMGIPLLDHKERYQYTREWLDAVETLWQDGTVTLDGTYFHLDQAVARPRPRQVRPLIVNAGQSYTGMSFAAERADYIFSRGRNAASFREIAEKAGSRTGFIGTKKVILGASDAEAHDRANAILAKADRGAVTAMMVTSGALRPVDGVVPTLTTEQVDEHILEEAIVGGPETVGRELAKWAVGNQVDGICLTLFDYLPDLEMVDGEVLPILGEELAAANRELCLEKP
jgi:pyrimidine oxygenase